jgi:putative tryptophan/tyrosine transport system substrate-binding protein
MSFGHGVEGCVRRRDFIRAVAGSAVAWPLASGAQHSALPVIGLIHSGSASQNTHTIAGFHDGLGEQAYVAGQNVTIEYRWADGQFDRLPTLAADLVGRGVAVLAAFAPPTAVAAKSATTTIPIVFFIGGDPVKLGLVASYRRPGGNITGIGGLTIDLVPKRLEILRELVPKADSIAFLVNPKNPTSETQIQSMREATRSLGLKLNIYRASSEHELDAAFAKISQTQAGPLVVGADSFFITLRDKIVALATRHGIPTTYETRESAAAGGLMSYAPSFKDAYRQVGVYVGRILKGERPADLPVLQPTKFELVINLKTAKTLGLDVPLSLQQRADEIIE